MMNDIDIRVRTADSWSGLNHVIKDNDMRVRTGIKIYHNIIIFSHMVQPNQD